MSEEELVPDAPESDEEEEFYESISFDASQVPFESRPEPEIEIEQEVDDEEFDIDGNADGTSTVQTGLNITKDLVNISNTVAMTGFRWASIGTEYGFGWTTSLLESSKAALERNEWGESSLAKAVTAAQAAVEVAHGITVAGLTGAEYLTAKSHSYADSALGNAGAKDGTLYKIMARKLMQSDEAGDAVVAILEFFYEFCEGHDIPLQQLPRALMLLAQLHKLCLKKPDQYSCKVLNGPALRADLMMYHNFVLGAAGINMLRLQGIISVLDTYESEDECTAAMAGISVEDILFRIPSKDVFMTSTYVALNRCRGEICVVFSGTSNHHDLLTDLTCRTTEWECNGETLQIHEGFARTVNLLEPILLPVVSQYRTEYGLDTVVCVGYSFGAAVASLLTLKWSKLFPTIRAYAFAPPGVTGVDYAALSTTMTVSVPLVRKTVTTSSAASSSDGIGGDVDSASRSAVETVSGEFIEYQRITGVILGNDMVPRLSLSSAEDLRDCIAYLLGNTSVMTDIEDAFKRYDAMLAKSAAAVAASNFMHDNEREGPAVAAEGDDEDDQQFRECSEEAVQLVAMLSEFDAIYKELVDTHCFRKNKLLPVGQLLFLEVVDTAAEPHTRVLNAKAGQFSSIVVSGDMLTCHLNNAYKTALDSI